MRVIFSYVRLVRGRQTTTDLAVTVDGTVTVSDLARALSATDPGRDPNDPASRGDVSLGREPSLRVLDRHDAHGLGSVVAASMPVATSGIRSGGTVAPVLITPRVPATVEDPAATTLTVLSGPDAGAVHRLSDGVTVIGRDPTAADIVLTDPLVSARHARITVGQSVEILDTGSSNGLVIQGSLVSHAVLRRDDRVLIGASTISVSGPRIASPANEVKDDTAFNRSPRLDPDFHGTEFEAPDPPGRPQRHRWPIIGMLAPLLMGVVLFAVTQSLLSIAFIALSPVLLIGGILDNRRHERRDTRDAERLFDESLRELRTELAQARVHEQVGRQAETPSTADALDALQRRTPLLWTRRPDDRRFLQVRMGIGRQDSRHTIILPSRSRAQPRHWRQLLDLQSEAASIDGVPVVADLRQCGSLGISGPRADVLGVARAVVIQLVGLHSPADLVVTAILGPASTGEWEWLKWLPHQGSGFSPLAGPHLVADTAAGQRLVAELEGLIDLRTEGRTGRRDAEVSAGSLPVVAVVVDGDAPIERARLVALAERGPAAGVHVLWTADRLDLLPAACRMFLDVDGSSATVGVGSVDTGRSITPVAVETIDAATAVIVARHLAPVTDSGVRLSDESDLPASVSLLNLLGREIAHDPEAVIARWRETESIVDRSGRLTPRRHASLRAVVGQTSQEPLTLDLRSQGPHALVGGTTGAGKSEFLQSWVLALAAGHSPDSLTFLFVDYKGGAAFADCVRLPHCVGLVTDLSPHLVRRALTSLNAELRHRERLLSARKAKDLAELQRRGDPEAPPSLVIVVDEFAALVQDVPEFVDGVVNVAQRGRSLGLHLILATQRPAGVIKENLRANTNLRVALRMADTDDSVDVLGDGQAADFPPDLPGRAAVKVGPGRVLGFQTGYAGGLTTSDAEVGAVDISELTFGSARRWEVVQPVISERPRALGPTDITRVVETVVRAAAAAEIPEPRRPWLPELADRYDLQYLHQRRDRELAVGVMDEPAAQRQLAVYFHPDTDGNMAVFGTGGSGKSTTLRTLAVSAAITPRSGPCRVYALDFGSAGLRMLESLPHVGDVIPGDDRERVTRLVAWLRDLVEERAEKYAKVRAGTITDYRSSTGEVDEPRILLLLDGLAGFRRDYEFDSRAGVFTMLTQIAADGRPVGVHLIVSADRPSTVPAALGSSIQRRLVHRLADDNDYLMLGTPADVLSASSPPGRAVLDGADVQVAVLGGRSDLAAQSAAIDRLARTMRERAVPPAPQIRKLPDLVLASDLDDRVDGRVVIGMADDTLKELGVDASGVLLIAGPPGSGRTSCLGAIAHAVQRVEHRRIYYLGQRGSSLPRLLSWERCADTPEDVGVLAELLTTELAAAPPAVVVIENLTDFLGGAAEMALQDLVKAIRHGPHLLLTDSETSTLSSSWPLIQLVRAARRGIALQPDQAEGDLIFRTTFPRLSRSEFAVGRGLLVESGSTRRLQIALPG